jgi:Integrase core domain
MLASMSRPANPYDNASCESFMKTLKQEEIYAHAYDDLEQLRENLQAFIERYYNQQRLHSALGYRSPEEFERDSQAASPPTAWPGASVSFSRHGELSPSDDGQDAGKPPTMAPQLIGMDESPVGYSSASCSPAELASALPTETKDALQGVSSSTNLHPTASVLKLPVSAQGCTPVSLIPHDISSGRIAPPKM